MNAYQSGLENVIYNFVVGKIISGCTVYLNKFCTVVAEIVDVIVYYIKRKIRALIDGVFDKWWIFCYEVSSLYFAIWFVKRN